MNYHMNHYGEIMKSITIHGIDEPLAKLIKSKARSEGLSINKTLKKVLEESLGVKPADRSTHLSDFDEFCGMWKDKDLSEFENKTKEFGRIDPEDWQ